MSERFPLHLEESWLDSWWSIGFLAALLVWEIVADCIPAVASFQDVFMLFAKPALSFALALAPSYGKLDKWRHKTQGSGL